MIKLPVPVILSLYIFLIKLRKGQGMNNKMRRQDFIKNFIRKDQVRSFSQILQKVNCADISLRRDLNSINAITSYTHNGVFITLRDIPVFDENGIWFCKDIGFTKCENSLELIVEVIKQSKKGISKKSLDKILRIDVYKQIHILLKRNLLNRVKIGNKYYYISESLAKNKKKRLQLLKTNNIEEYYDTRVTSSDLIALLKAVLIEHKIKIEEQSLKRFAIKYSLKIPIEKIQQLLLKYHLLEKKSIRTLERIKK